mmetsp:Transcript_24310/g.36464  ORF Transcript_24310/g.36464 Transcript_24310/m.36464 type:complete len:743 (-) Transcript_24310:93-2321(-)
MDSKTKGQSDNAKSPPKIAEMRRRSNRSASSSKHQINQIDQLTNSVHAQVLGVFLAAGLAALLYYNYVLWTDYLDVFAWSFLACQALHSRKENLVLRLRKYREGTTSTAETIGKVDNEKTGPLESLIEYLELHPFYIGGLGIVCFLGGGVFPWLPVAFVGGLLSLGAIWLFARSALDVYKLATKMLAAAVVSVKKVFSSEVKRQFSMDKKITAEQLKKMLKDAEGSTSSLVEYAPLWFLFTLMASCVTTVTGIPFVIVIAAMGLACIFAFQLRGAFLRALLPILQVLGLSDEIAAALFLSFGTLITIGFALIVLVIFGCVDVVGGLSVIYGSARTQLDNAATKTDVSALVANMTNSMSDGIGSAYDHFESTYHEEQWWPIASGVYTRAKEGEGTALIITETMETAKQIYSNETWWEYVEKAETLYHSATTNLTASEDLTFEKISKMSFQDIKELLNEFHGWSEFMGWMSVLGEQMWEQIGLYASYASSYLLANTTVILSGLGSALSVLWGYIAAASGQVTWAVLLCYFVNTLLTAEEDYLSIAIAMLFPGVERPESLHEVPLSTRLRHSIEAVLWMPIEIACLNTSLTLVTFQLLGFPFYYVAGFIALILSFVRVLDDYSYLFVVPWALACCLNVYWETKEWNNFSMYIAALRSTLLFAIHYWGQDWIQNTVIEKRRSSIGGGFLTDLSVGLGLVAFGAKGLVLGPLLTSIFVLFLSEVAKKAKKDIQNINLSSKLLPIVSN